jgi:hypothetical protein
MRAASVAFLLIAVSGCAQTGTTPTRGTAPPSAQVRQAPGKCSACHLAPREHTLDAERWPAYLKAHKRRLHLSDEEQAFLYDFLVGGELSAAKAP